MTPSEVLVSVMFVHVCLPLTPYPSPVADRRNGNYEPQDIQKCLFYCCPEIRSLSAVNNGAYLVNKSMPVYCVFFCFVFFFWNCAFSLGRLDLELVLINLVTSNRN